jgi:mannose-1-phosphate guanylyltransferase
VIGEPVGRNTAPCAVWAAALALSKDPSATLGIFPADHYIRDEKKFAKTLRAAYRTAGQEGCPVTLGINPEFPHTGYGYLEMGPRFSMTEGVPFFHLKKFHEKPEPAAAARYCRSGKFLWNAGIFIWRADCLLETARRHLPAVFDAATAIVGEKITGARLRTLFAAMPNISIDYGLMEKIPGEILTVPVSMGWNDVGGWAALKNLLAKDAKGNVTSGRTLLVDSTGNLVRSKGKLIAAIGLKDHVVVESEDAILVCPMDKTESIRKIVQELQKKNQQYL